MISDASPDAFSVAGAEVRRTSAADAAGLLTYRYGLDVGFRNILEQVNPGIRHTRARPDEHGGEHGGEEGRGRLEKAPILKAEMADVPKSASNQDGVGRGSLRGAHAGEGLDRKRKTRHDAEENPSGQGGRTKAAKWKIEMNGKVSAAAQDEDGPKRFCGDVRARTGSKLNRFCSKHFRPVNTGRKLKCLEFPREKFPTDWEWQLATATLPQV